MVLTCEDKRRRKTMLADLYLPDECWEHVITFLINHNRCMEVEMNFEVKLLEMNFEVLNLEVVSAFCHYHKMGVKHVMW
jgi:hypothetical protein